MTDRVVGTGRTLAVASTDDDARAAAEAVLSEGGSALDAVLSGYLAAAGANAWALLAPIVIGVAGAGAGVKFIDGRARQPGIGLVRPVRYEHADEAPAIARVSVPASAVALALAASGDVSKRLARLAAAGVRAAKAEGALARARLLGRIGDVGGLALTERWFLDEITQNAPRIEGNPLTAADLDAVRATVEAPRDVLRIGGRSLLTPSWSQANATATSVGRDAIVVADGRGALAGASWEHTRDGAPIFGGEVLLPAAAVPVLKGVTRVKPGEPLATPAPLGFVVDASLRATSLLATTLSLLNDDLVGASSSAEAVEAWAGGGEPLASLAGGAQLLIALCHPGPRPAPAARRIVGEA